VSAPWEWRHLVARLSLANVAFGEKDTIRPRSCVLPHQHEQWHTLYVCHLSSLPTRLHLRCCCHGGITRRRQEPWHVGAAAWVRGQDASRGVWVHMWVGLLRVQGRWVNVTILVETQPKWRFYGSNPIHSSNYVTCGSVVRGKVVPIRVRNVFNCFPSLQYRCMLVFVPKRVIRWHP
jgi:hypothetical protein